MLLLAMDTSTPCVSVALGTEGAVLGVVQLARLPGEPQRHAEQLVPAVAYLARELGVGLDQLACVAVGIGPGLFTGLRVGVTTAKVMAQSLRVPVVGISSLDLVAYRVRHTSRLIAAVLDGRRQEVFYALYRPVPGGVQRVSEYEVGTPDDLASELLARGEEALLVGDGALLYRDRLLEVQRCELAGRAYATPSPSALVELASARFEREEFTQPRDLHPMYLRKSDAELEWDRSRP
ncbi:MAG: tRNA (adenosine(37)-N6)-threonylcarbamoyltransferase complex dimerization subunit type 1 TsaB [Acidimicrobiia bacterium]